jgi:hypothetical protein
MRVKVYDRVLVRRDGRKDGILSGAFRLETNEILDVQILPLKFKFYTDMITGSNIFFSICRLLEDSAPTLKSVWCRIKNET